MNTVLSGIQNYRCFVYLDDIVIHAGDLESQNNRLKEVFERLSKFHLKIQPDEYEFLSHEFMYLGHLIADSGVKPDPGKVKAVVNYPRPASQKDIRDFLGLADYRRFIPKFSEISKP